MAAELATTEKKRLTELEGVIERGLETFLEVGKALAEIRDSRLYRAEHQTFEAYCKAHFGFTRRRGNQLIAAAAVGTVVPVSSERQARELAKLKDSEESIILAYRNAQELAKKHGGRVTSQDIRFAVEDIGRENAYVAAVQAGNAQAVEEFGRSGPLKKLRHSPRGTYRGGGRPVRPTPASIAASERAAAASAAIRTAAGLDPLPETATVAAWRHQLSQNGNGSAPPDVRKIIASIEKLRASLPDDSPDHIALTKALDALGEVA